MQLFDALDAHLRLTKMMIEEFVASFHPEWQAHKVREGLGVCRMGIEFCHIGHAGRRGRAGCE